MRIGGHRQAALLILGLACLALHPSFANAQEASSPDALPPPSTTEIPSAVIPSQNAASPDLYNSGAGAPAAQEPQPPAELRQEMQDLHDFMGDSDGTSSLGMVLHEAHRSVDGNGEVAGLLVVEVLPGTAAAAAGLRGDRAGISNALTGVAFAASLFFPPASLAAAAVSSSRIGESYDLIIGIDSARVTNFLEFSDRMRFARPGELVYLSISRNGRRILVPVTVPTGAMLGSP